MRMMADLLRRGRYADEIMGRYAQEDRRQAEACACMGRNDPCPCGARDKEGKPPSRSRDVTASKALSLSKDGSGRKVKQCHGK